MNLPDVIKVVPISIDAIVKVVPLVPEVSVSIVPSPGKQGIQGIQGIQGDQGPQGIQGKIGGSYEHNQTAVASIWVINHNLGYHPSISVVDSGGTSIETEAWYTSINTVEVRLSSGISGKAYLS